MTSGAPLPVDSSFRPMAYAWPGGYPIYYVTEQNNVLCSQCAAAPDWPDDLPMACDVNWEDPAMFCEQCNRRIESAYAEDDATGAE